MADIYKIQTAVTFTQQTPMETFRLMDAIVQVSPTSYQHGKVTIPANTADVLIADDVNIFVMFSSSGLILKVNSTTSPAMNNITHFSYNGAKTSFYVSNSGTEDISLTFSSAKI